METKPQTSPRAWRLKTQTITASQTPLIMGIVNVTPDSFSDGGHHDSVELAVRHALQLAQDGADILDIGGESTRPYSTPVELQAELDRVIPVIERLSRETPVPISIDTSKSEVARQAIAAGAEIINDVTGLEGDPNMLAVAVESGAGVCAMHMQGTPQDMQDNPQYENIVSEIYDYLRMRKTALLEAGVELEKICLDPGVGFGKTHQHNLELIANCEQFLTLGCPILIGHSRKGFIGRLMKNKEANRDAATCAISLLLAQKQIHIVRVHEVENTAFALKTLAGVGGVDGSVAQLD